MTFQEAREIARQQSKEGVQHVNARIVRIVIDGRTFGAKVDDGRYSVSDWSDGTTVISYQNGREL